MVLPDRAQHLRVGRVTRLALPARRQAELLEEHASDLLRRADHELLAREVVGLCLQLLDTIGEPGSDLAHPVGVDLHSRRFHVGEHGGERQFDRAVEVGDAAFLEALE